MKKNCGFIFCVLVFVLGVSAQQKVILDTDPSFDPDDVGCMAMLHTMATQGECDILAVVNSTNQKESALCISAINQFYNRLAIPVGDYKGYTEKIHATEGTYDYHIAKDYPRALKNWEASLDGVQLYREVLASAQDTSITVVIIGTMHNFYGLLKSGPDRWSPQNGPDLVQRKVKKVVTMGGNFLNNEGLDRTNWGGSDELCAYTEWSCLNEERNRMCRYVIENFPAPFIASGWENGNGDYFNAENGNVMSGQGLKKLAADHIARVSYEKHFEYRGGAESITRHSNDQIALHYAIRGEENNYTAFLEGKITLTESGECHWEAIPNGLHGHIQKKREDALIASEIESLMMGATPVFDASPPTVPQQPKIVTEHGKRVLTWNHSNDPDPGSWVVAYDVYKDGNLIHRAFGTRYVLDSSDGAYEVRAINASGSASAPAKIEN
ncbi:MAG: nucleoside hydrolase [Flavobacteriaceae bacterium]|nr:nucleoside hydrolase [Flavobacteriaceae bacterium]